MKTSAPNPAPTKGFVLGLDGVRCFAVIAVIAAHTHVSWMHGGGVGVDIFFVLSGYLITTLLLREFDRNGRISLSLFWGRRLVRLMPALILLLVVVNTAAAISPYSFAGTGAVGLAATPAILFYFSNWLIVIGQNAALGNLGPLWSLSVEEQFYLIWPLIVVFGLARRRSLRWLGASAGLIILTVIVNRVLVFNPDQLTRTFGTDFRVDALLIGCLLALGFRAGLAKAIGLACRVLVVPAILYLVAVSLFIPEFNAPGVERFVYLYYTVGLPLASLATAVLIGYIVLNQDSLLVRALSWGPFAFTGRISYGMYLWHYPIIIVLMVRVQPDPNSLFLISLALTYVAAIASWFLVERPISRRLHARLIARPRVSA